MSQKSAKAGAGGGGKAAAKGKKGAAGGGKKAEDEREETLQAVILADSFETRFSPFTLEVPRCLLPLANTPLIEYTLEFLAMSGVADIFIYCGAHTSAIESYIEQSRWSPKTSTSTPFRTLEIVKTTARSVGDAMRDLDARDLITGDFLLVHGDLVSNLLINTALAAHRARRQKDKNAIMTMVLRSGGLDAHRTKSKGITPVFVVDPTKDRCLHYEEMHPLQAHKYVNIDPELLSSHPEMEIRSDLIDCGIDICTPEVLALWAESFDYEVPRRHFLHGVLKDYELNGQTIHTEIVDDHYAARVSTLQAYEAVSKDVLGRWTYPLVPDSNLMPDQTYKLDRGGLCKENGVILARTCKAGKRTVLGKDTSIGDGSIVSNSIIGRRCQIGKNVRIENSYIWDDVLIGDGAIIDRAIIANEVAVGNDSKILAGALLSYGVRTAPGIEIKENTRITRAKRKAVDSEAAATTVPTDTSIVGSGGSGYLYNDDDDDFDDETDPTILETSLVYSTKHLNLSTESISTISSDVASSADTLTIPRSRLSSFTGSINSINSDGEPTSSTNEAFHHDAVSGLIDALHEGRDFDSAKLEFMGLRLSNDATDHQIRRAIAIAFTKFIAQLTEGGGGDANPEGRKWEASKAAGKAFDVPGVQRFLKEVAVAGGGDEKVDDQIDFLSCLEDGVRRRGERGGVVLAALCQRLYLGEIVEEEAFLEWWGNGEGGKDGGDGATEEKGVREKVSVFIEWLRNADEEESSEEEDSD